MGNETVTAYASPFTDASTAYATLQLPLAVILFGIATGP